MRRITGTLRHNDWGDRHAIAALRQVEPSGRPEAEYWLGAHHRAPSPVVEPTGATTTLDRLIAADAEAKLGPSVAKRFGELPFLLKLLAAGKPLSIQAHPNLEQAEAGFAREDEAGIDPAAPNRNYRDANHKPEMICALTTFEAKCGFRPLYETRRLLDLFTDPRVEPLKQRVGSVDSTDESGTPSEAEHVLADVVRWLLTLDPVTVADLVSGLVEEAAALGDRAGKPGDPAAAFQPELAWTPRINASFPGDVGVAVALLLNHLTLQPGQAVFLDAGNMHAYLSGLAVELMANSDNVLRGGLTAKHIDVAELLRVVRYRPLVPEVQTAAGSEHHYRVPVPEFELIRHCWSGEPERNPKPDLVQVWGPEILLVTSGSVAVDSGDGSDGIVLDQGEAAFAGYDDGSFELAPRSADTVLWRAVVGR